MPASFVPPVNVLEVLDEAEFPATLAELIDFAEDNDASEDVLDIIRAMPDREYASIQDVNRHMSQLEVEEGEENLYSSADLTEQRREPGPADDVNVARRDHRLGNWATSGNGDTP